MWAPGMPVGLLNRRPGCPPNNLVVNGTILGTPEDAAGGSNPVEAQEVCVAREIDGRSVVAEQILVVGDSRLARLSADGAIRVDRDLVGGQAICRQALTVAGNVGTEEGGSRTRVVVTPGAPSRRQKRLALAFHKQKKALGELQEKRNHLEAAASKRAKSDPYWAALLSGDLRKPRTPVEANTLRQFKDMLNEKKDCVRSISEVRLTIRGLQEQAEAETEEAEASDVCVRVGKRLYLDVSFEVIVNVEEEAMESQVTYTIEEKRFRNHTLKDIRSELSKQARAYLEARSSSVEERRQAIEEMFKDAEHRPAGPQVKHKRFELSFTWSGPDDGANGEAGMLQVSTTAFVDTSESGRLYVRTAATVREVLEGVEISISQEGPRVGFSVGGCQASQIKWQEDSEVLQMLDGIVFRGLSAQAFLNGAEALVEGNS